MSDRSRAICLFCDNTYTAHKQYACKCTTYTQVSRGSRSNMHHVMICVHVQHTADGQKLEYLKTCKHILCAYQCTYTLAEPYRRVTCISRPERDRHRQDSRSKGSRVPRPHYVMICMHVSIHTHTSREHKIVTFICIPVRDQHMQASRGRSSRNGYLVLTHSVMTCTHVHMYNTVQI
jgi:hypothetical protein